MGKFSVTAWLYPILLGAASLYSMPLFAEVALSSPVDCQREISLHCGKTPSALIDNRARLWVVFEQADRIYISQSEDMGQTYSLPVAVNKQPEPIYTNGENRPKIAMGSKGEIYLSWTLKTAGRYTGDIRFSRSLDGGKNFTDPVTINNDGLLTSHRFDALQVSESGHIYIAWLDKRDQSAAKKQHINYTGAALYFAVSEDAGASFADNYRVANNSCECCRIASETYADNEVVVFWRHIFDGGMRDHAYAVLKANGESDFDRATVDNWQLDACPHHGPDMAAAIEETDYHMVWFSNGDQHKGIYYQRQNLTTGVKLFEYLVDASTGASHPQVASHNDKVVIAWKSFDGETMRISLISSVDNGQTWSDAVYPLQTKGSSDHPALIESNTGLFLAWHTQEEGYRFVALD